MSSSKLQVLKSIFQVAFPPDIGFYDHLYSAAKKISGELFEHWQTNALNVVLKSYIHHHNLGIYHDNITFESDNYKPSIERKIVEAIADFLSEVSEDDAVLRTGHRFQAIYPVDMEFSVLNDILKVKLFTNSLMDAVSMKQVTPRVVLASTIDDIPCNLHLEGTVKSKIGDFIKFNTDKHVDNKSIDSVQQMINRIKSYPEVALLIDFDYRLPSINKANVIGFYEASVEAQKKVCNNLISYLFADKI